MYAIRSYYAAAVVEHAEALHHLVAEAGLRLGARARGGHQPAVHVQQHLSLPLHDYRQGHAGVHLPEQRLEIV